MIENVHEDEQCLLAAVMADPDAMIEASAIVGPTDFDSVAHGSLWRLLEAMREAGEDIGDRRRLIGNIKHDGLLEKLGGAATFGRHYIDAGVAGNALLYARFVKNHSLRRHLSEMCLHAGAEIEACDDPTAMGQELRAMIDRLMSSASPDNECMTLHDASKEQLDLMRRPAEHESGKLLSTGIECIDELYGGFRTGGSYVIAARPGDGKSALMKQIANRMDRSGKKTLIVSLEMDPREIAARVLSERTGINGKLLEVDEDGEDQLSASEWHELETAVRETEGSGMFIHAPTGRNATIERIAGYTRLMNAKHGIQVLMLDYLQLVEKSDTKQSDYEKVTAASRILKNLARELGIAVVALSQLNRGSEKGGTPREPRLSDLRDSGAVEQDADAVMILHRITDHMPDFLMIVPKWRNGGRSKFELRLRGELTMFEPPPIADHPNYEPAFAEHSV